MEDFVHTIIDKERFETLQGLRELVSLHVKILFFLSIFFLILNILLITNKLKLFITEYNDRNAPHRRRSAVCRIYGEAVQRGKKFGEGLCIYIIIIISRPNLA